MLVTGGKLIIFDTEGHSNGQRCGLPQDRLILELIVQTFDYQIDLNCQVRSKFGA